MSKVISTKARWKFKKRKERAININFFKTCMIPANASLIYNSI